MHDMKMLAVVFGLAVRTVLAASAADGDPALEARKPLKVLSIGNSFSVQMAYSMPPVARALGLDLDICALYIGGCTLERHWGNVCKTDGSQPYDWHRNTCGKAFPKKKANIPEVLNGEEWDVVVIQQGSHQSWRAESYHPDGDNLVRYIREKAPKAKIVVHETWSYTPWDRRLAGWKIDQNEMYAKLHAAYGDFAKAHGLDVIPTGTAVQIVRRDLPVVYAENSLGGDVVGSCTFVQEGGKWIPKGDVFHMGPDGNYLQALVWTAKLFDRDVAACTYRPGKMKDERAAFLKACAVKAVSAK